MPEPLEHTRQSAWFEIGPLKYVNLDQVQHTDQDEDGEGLILFFADWDVSIEKGTPAYDQILAWLQARA